jgi:hypothetical protein
VKDARNADGLRFNAQSRILISLMFSDDRGAVFWIL